MGEDGVLGSRAKRVELGSGAMLYDTSRAGNLTPEWFDPLHWAERGAIEGEARGRGTTVFVRDGESQFALRHYRRGGLVGKLVRDAYLWCGEGRVRPFVEWRLIHSLHRAGLPVPAPIAARYRRSGGTYTGDLITARIGAARSLAQRIHAADLPLADWIAVGRCIRRFHDFGLCHADLNAHNVLFDENGTVWLIDFDRGRLRRAGLWRDANLVRLRRSLHKISDPLPPGHFTETDWQSLLAGYAASPLPPTVSDQR
ncbi:MAG: 3-deoxy-D-manno-octulosonic acid kinase [Steroidobacteraceae bacterium]|nr:3-deoxy-D-manno-octulosonic acid kinase [Nevskiaceae bacterium]